MILRNTIIFNVHHTSSTMSLVLETLKNWEWPGYEATCT